jgi:DNA polymerase-1
MRGGSPIIEQPTLGVEVEQWPWPAKQQIPTSDGWNPTLRSTLVQDESALREMVNTLSQVPTFAWDTEGSGLKPELGARVIGHSFTARTGKNELHGWYVPIRHIGVHNERERQLAPELVTEALTPVFASGGEVKTFHGKYDRKMARADGLELLRPYCDVAIEATIHNENEPRFALKALSEKYCTPIARGEEDMLDDWMRKDSKALKLSFRKHSKAFVRKVGLINALQTPTYLERFGYARTPIKLCGQYAIHDTTFTWWLDEVKYRRDRENYAALWKREHAVSNILFEMEWYGLQADEACIRGTHDRTKADVEYWLSECRRLCPAFIGANFAATDEELRTLLFVQLKLDPPKHTKKGAKPAVDKEARKLLEKKYPEHAELLKALNQLAVVTKLHSTYSGNYLRYYSPTTHSIHPSYNQLEQRAEGGVPVTGRLSSADPNNQNVASRPLHLSDCFCTKCIEDEEKIAKKESKPQKKTVEMIALRQLRGLPVENKVSVRRYFTVPEGYIRIYIDFSQIELRVLTWFCQDPNLLEAYRLDLDLHQMVADQLGISRRVAKEVNFGNSYGMTEIGLALRMPGYYDDPDATREEAKRVLKAYFEKYRGILTFRAKFAAAMRRNHGMFVSPFGRPRRIAEISSTERWERERAERKMMSSIVSGTSADLMKESMLRTEPMAREGGGRMVQTIHDELVFDLPRQSGWAANVLRMKRSMEDWPMFSVDRPTHKGVPIKTNIALSTTTWEDKKEIKVLDDGTFQWAA